MVKYCCLCSILSILVIFKRMFFIYLNVIKNAFMYDCSDWFVKYQYLRSALPNDRDHQVINVLAAELPVGSIHAKGIAIKVESVQNQPSKLFIAVGVTSKKPTLWQGLDVLYCCHWISDFWLQSWRLIAAKTTRAPDQTSLQNLFRERNPWYEFRKYPYSSLSINM